MFTPHTGKGSGRGDGSSARWISAASSSSRRTRSCSTSTSAVRAFAIAIAAQAASTWSRLRVALAEEPIAATAVDHFDRADRTVGRAASERTGSSASRSPTARRAVCEKWGSLATSSTHWQVFSRTLRPTMPSRDRQAQPRDRMRPDTGMTGDLASVALRQPERARLGVELGRDQRERALERRRDVHREGEVLAHRASRARAPARSLRSCVESSDPSGVAAGRERELVAIRGGVGGMLQGSDRARNRLETVEVR